MTELPHIRYLYVVSEVFRLGRISAAADAVHVSQPAATQSLARIEELLGVQLFERRPQGMYPTETGAIFETRLNRILEHLQRGDSEARKRAARSQAEPPRKVFHKFCSPVQIRAILAVAKTGSFNAAAQELGISRPGVHRALRDLGSLSGMALFDQTRGGVVLTAMAETFVRHVKLADSEFRQAVFEINEFLGRDTTRINLGSLPLSRTSILPAAIDRLLRDAGAGVQVNCVEARYHTLLRDLRFGDLDFLIGALRTPLPASDVVQEELFRDHLALVTGPDHPLARRETVALQETLSFPWVAPPRETPSGSYLFETLRIHEQPETPVRIVSSSLIMLRGLLERGPYISIASKKQIEAERDMGMLVELPVPLDDSGRAIGLTFRAGWIPTPMQGKLLDVIREIAQSGRE